MLKAAVSRYVPPRLLSTASEDLARAAGILSDYASTAAVKRQLAHLAQSGKPLVVGPWLSEVGFEVLYWIPFLRWAQRTYDLAPERLIVVSRGGAAGWYRDISQRYADILDYFTPDEFRLRNDQRIAAFGRGLKHWGSSSFDEAIVARVRASLDLGDADLLHPSLMYELFYPFWRKRASFERIERHTTFSRFAPPRSNEIPDGLPAEYVAVKFYFNNSFPDVPENRAFIADLLAGLAEQTDVVVLTTGFELDDHADWTTRASGRVHLLGHLLGAAKNLALQTGAIAGAQAFLGTYGGFSYLAPSYGVHSLAFYSDPTKFLPQHLDVARTVFHRLGTASFVALDARDIGALSLLSRGPAPTPP
jgi:hypothetical protein